MKPYIFTSFLIGILLFTSCEYQPAGTNYIEVNPNFSQPNAMIKYPADVDTIFYYAGKNPYLRYELEGDTSRFSRVIFFLDSDSIYCSTSAKGYFSIKTEITKKLVCTKLIMTAVFSSGTNSLADQLGGEGSLLNKSWYISFYNHNKYSIGD